MSFFRLYTAPDSYTDYPDIWDVSVSPDEISGASYWQHESRSANLTMPYISTFQSYRNDPAKPPIYRLLGEIWEDLNYIDSEDGTDARTKLLFRGYLFQNSFQFNTLGTTNEGNVQLVTLTLYDYIAVLEYFLTHRWQIPLSTGGLAWIGRETTTLPYDSDINVYSEYQRLWNYVPAHPTEPGYPLWSRPPLDIDLPIYPGYGYVYQNANIYEQTPLENYGSLYDMRVYEQDGEAYLDEVKLRLIGPESLCGYYYYYNKYRITAGRLLQIPGYPIIKSGKYWILSEWSREIGSVMAELGITEYYEFGDWQSQYGLTISQYGNTRSYNVLMTSDTPDPNFGWVNIPKYIGLTGAANYDVLHTLPQPDLEVAESSWVPGWLQEVAEYFTGLGVPNPAVIATPTTNASGDISGWDVPAREWLSFILLLNFAWLRYDDPGYTLTNRLFVEGDADVTTFEMPRVTAYNEYYDVPAETYGGGVSCIVDNDLYVEGIDKFAKTTYARYNRICEWSGNMEAEVGTYVWLNEHNPNAIQVTSVEYDPQTPFLWHYTGRSS